MTAPEVNSAAPFLDDTDQAEPNFLRQNMQRQRECFTRGLCQVCGRQIPARRRLLVVATLSVETITLAGQQVPVVAEPWLDGECADFALAHCPSLIRRRRDESLSLVSVPAARNVQLVISHGWVEGPLERDSKRLQPAMWVKAALRDVHPVAVP